MDVQHLPTGLQNQLTGSSYILAGKMSPKTATKTSAPFHFIDFSKSRLESERFVEISMIGELVVVLR